MRDPSSNRQIGYERQGDIHDWPRALEGYNLCQRNRSNKNKIGGDVELYIPHIYSTYSHKNSEMGAWKSYQKCLEKTKGEKNKSNNSDAIRRIY